MKDMVLGNAFITEAVSTPEDNNFIKPRIVELPYGVAYAEFEACLHSFDVWNRNNRQYKLYNVKDKLFNDPVITAYLKDNAWFGEADHPYVRLKGDELTRQTLSKPTIERISHKIMKPRFDESANMLFATIQTDTGDRGFGRDFFCKIVQGMVPGFSCRSFAELVYMNNIPVVLIKKLITYDWVLYRSHVEACATSDIAFKSKAPQLTTESGNVSCDHYEKIIPVKQLLEYVADKEDSIKIIMEAFDMDKECLKGFTKEGNPILKDSRHTIYGNIPLSRRKEVNGFLKNM